jgi:hypothetical protein
MTTISRVDRPSLTAVSAAVNAGVTDLGTPPETSGTTQQRHQARVSQQYALAQYAANQQFADRQRELYPDGNLPPVRDYLREQPTPTAPAATPAAQTQSPELLLDEVRKLVELRTTSVLTDAEFTQAVASLVRA